MRKKLGLALGAGGARGVAHVGFLQALEEEGIQADYVTGCSMGSIVGVCYCAGISMSVVKDAVLNLSLLKIASLNVNPIRMNGVFRMTKARKLLESYLGAHLRFEDLKIPFRCVATDIISGKTIEMKEGNVIDAVVASASIPGVFSPQEKDGMLLVDGGVLERVPVKELKNMGAEVIVAVDVLGDLTAERPAPKNLIASFLRFIDVIDTNVTKRNRRSRSKNIHLWLEPQLGDMDQYQVKNLAFAYEKGYELGKENAEKIRALLGE
ncbi:MAG: patatin-like phospholipase family protein [Clostridia bacterium]|nr:patatin-like phospholipase family protein [Clostridia bacterium]